MGSWEVRGGLGSGNQIQDASSSFSEEGPGMVAAGAQRTPGPDVEPVSGKVGLAEASGLGASASPSHPLPVPSLNSWLWEFNVPSSGALPSTAKPCLLPESFGLSSQEILIGQGSRPGKSA